MPYDENSILSLEPNFQDKFWGVGTLLRQNIFFSFECTLHMFFENITVFYLLLLASEL